MPTLSLVCRNITPFKPNKDLDEDAFRQFCRRMVESGVGLYMASAGSGQGWTLTRAELQRLYTIGVEECKGKVPVNANLPEQPTARLYIEQAKIAMDAGVDLVNVYGPAPVHGYRTNPAEAMAFFDAFFAEVDYPASIAPNIMQPRPSPQLMAAIANRHPQVKLVMMMGMDDAYYVALREALTRDIPINVPLLPPLNPLHALLLGANGVITNAASIIPKTYRLYCDLFDRRDFNGLAKVYLDLLHFEEYASQFRTWHKVALKAFGLPGGDGGVRPPYLDPTEEDVERFRAGLPALRIPEVDELMQSARAVPAGV